MTALRADKSTLPARPILIAFLLFVVFGGGASVPIHITYAELDPFWAATSRFALAALAFWDWFSIKRSLFQRDAHCKASSFSVR